MCTIVEANNISSGFLGAEKKHNGYLRLTGLLDRRLEMKHRLGTAVTALLVLGLHTHARAQFLGTAESFAVLGGSMVTNANVTTLSGNLGVWPGNAITGFPPGIVTNGTTYAGDMVAMQAQSDVATAYNVLANEPFSQNFTGQDLGGKTLLPGVYHFDTSAFLTGTLTLDTLGDPNARFDFQIGSTLITASGSSVRVINSADDCDVFWQVGSSATLGTGTAFTGHILALTSITLNTGATVLDGGVLARNGAVTLDSNTVAICPTSTVPEPSSLALLGAVGIAALIIRRRK